MEPEEALRQGDLPAALSGLEDRVRKDPTEARHRIFLFQLLAVIGEWERALKQLRALADLDAAHMPLAWTYRAAIQGEVFREKVFRGEATPPLFGDPAAWTALLLEALRLTVTGEEDKGEKLRMEAFESAPAVSGRIGEAPFEWIADADTRFGPVVELVVEGRYGWAPFDTIRWLEIEPPEDLRDLVWIPARLQWRNGGEVSALVPVRYPGTASLEDTALLLSRRTDWRDCGVNCQAGLGQRMWATDRSEYALLETRHIELDLPEDASANAGDG